MPSLVREPGCGSGCLVVVLVGRTILLLVGWDGRQNHPFFWIWEMLEERNFAFKNDAWYLCPSATGWRTELVRQRAAQRGTERRPPGLFISWFCGRPAFPVSSLAIGLTVPSYFLFVDITPFFRSSQTQLRVHFSCLVLPGGSVCFSLLSHQPVFTEHCCTWWVPYEVCFAPESNEL